ncbi:ankyrin [Hypomontagnella monticulosa]|nr:ankyrin [Hypomontagnella monticulosa]
MALKMQDAFISPRERLHAAARDNDIKAIEAFLRDGPSGDLHYVNPIWGTPLHVAVWCAHPQVVRLLLDRGADPLLEHDQALTHDSAMHIAAQRGNWEIMPMLWYRVDPELHANELSSCLEQAATYGQSSFVDWFLSVWEGWEMATKERALRAAVSRWRFKVVDILLRRIEYSEKVLYEMLGQACSFKIPLPGEIHSEYEGEDYQDQQRIIERLVESGLNPDGSISDEPFLHQAANYIELWRALEALLNKGANADIKDRKGQTLLHKLTFPIPVRNMSGECRIHQKGIELLLRNGASTSIKNSDGETPLDYAAFAFGLDNFQLYLPAPAPPHLLTELNDHGESLLHYAAAGANVDVLEYLLCRDLDINARNNNGWTPFMCALANTSKGMHKRGPFSQVHEKTCDEAVSAAVYLLSRQADPNVVTMEGWTPLHSLAAYIDTEDSSNSEAATLAHQLIRQGADIEARAAAFLLGWEEKHRKTAMEMPFYTPLPWGFRVNAIMKQLPGAVRQGITPLHWAAENGSLYMVRLLLLCGADASAEDEKRSTPETTARYSTRLARKPELKEKIINLLKERE